MSGRAARQVLPDRVPCPDTTIGSDRHPLWMDLSKRYEIGGCFSKLSMSTVRTPVLTGFLPVRLKGCILGTHTN